MEGVATGDYLNKWVAALALAIFLFFLGIWSWECQACAGLRARWQGLNLKSEPGFM